RRRPAGRCPRAGGGGPGGAFRPAPGGTGRSPPRAGPKARCGSVGPRGPPSQPGPPPRPGEPPRRPAPGVTWVWARGTPDPAMPIFARQRAGAASRDPGWTFGTASQALTRAYNPRGYLDVYFLLDSSGRVAYINSAPASTMSQLLAHAGGLT